MYSRTPGQAICVNLGSFPRRVHCTGKSRESDLCRDNSESYCYFMRVGMVLAVRVFIIKTDLLDQRL